MKQTITKNYYDAFGLKILSAIDLPELSPISFSLGTEDIVIESGDLTLRWNESANLGKSFYIKKNDVLFMITDTAIFSVTDGNKIIVSPIAGADENKIRLYILGTCMGALLLQRKIMPLHGSAIAIDGKAYAIVGERGAGKSTLASAFIKKGFKLLSDDVIPVTFIENDPTVISSYPQQKLWQESLTAFGMDASELKPLFERETKYAVPVADHFQADPLELAGVFELIKSGGEEVSIHKVQGLERFPILYRHTFRSFLIPQLGLTEWHFYDSSRLMSKSHIYQLRRPASTFTAHQLAELILNTIRKDEKKDEQKIDNVK